MKNSEQNQFFTLPEWLDNYAGQLRFLLFALLIFAALQAAYFFLLLPSNVYLSYLELCAYWSAELLMLVGEDVVLHSARITSPAGPSVHIVEGCDALRLFSTLIAVMLAYKASALQKLAGLLIGCALLFILNLVRIAMLLWIDIHYTQWFDFFHATLLPIGLWFGVLAVFYVWGIWVLGAARAEASH